MRFQVRSLKSAQRACTSVKSIWPKQNPTWRITIRRIMPTMLRVPLRSVGSTALRVLIRPKWPIRLLTPAVPWVFTKSTMSPWFINASPGPNNLRHVLLGSPLSSLECHTWQFVIIRLLLQIFPLPWRQSGKVVRFAGHDVPATDGVSDFLWLFQHGCAVI